MRQATGRVWRTGPITLALIVAFAVVAGLVIPTLAYLTWSNRASSWIPALLTFLTLVALGYIWRFGLHPRLRADREGVEVINPFARYRFDWNEITVIAPGENGLVVASEDQQAEAWCVQKSNFMAKRGRFTRADRIAAQLMDLLEQHDPPPEDTVTQLRIRRARADEARLLARLERAASEDALAHIFRDAAFPVTAVNRRWRAELRDRTTRVHVLEHRDEPVGYLAYDATTVRQLGVVADHTRRGYGTALLAFATEEIFARGTAEASLWVLVDNTGARTFYRTNGWRETDDRRRSEFPPHPESMRMSRVNAAAPKRGR